MNSSPGSEPSLRFDTAEMYEAFRQIARERDESLLFLSELQHRMKNNLQTIQSLLRVKKVHIRDMDVRRELGHIEMHIAALNGVDGELLIADLRRPVALANYLRRLASKLNQLFGSISRPVTFRLELNEIEVPAKVAANIGLLVNEAITNSFKHAVPHGATEIVLNLIRDGEFAELLIGDNGPGFDPSKQSHARGTLLIERLADRLSARLQRKLVEPGTYYTLKIPMAYRLE